MSKYSLLILFFMILSLMVLFFMFIKMSFSINFLIKYMYEGFLIFLVVVGNIYMILVDDFIKLSLSLILLSFYSFFLMSKGYGVGASLNTMLLFKIMSDILVYVLMGFFYFFKIDSLMVFTSLGEDIQFNIEMALILMFSMYSLLGVFGFWIYWGMEASYFVSLYMHSCGFISVGFILFLKLMILGLMNFMDVKLYLYFISIISYLFFSFLFLTIKDLKKSFGYFSASSICFLFMVGLVNPTLSMIYFFVSSTIKMVIFELISYMNKSKSNISWLLFWMSVLYLINFSIFLLAFINVNSGDFLSVYLFIVFFMKSYYLLMFLIKTLVMFESLSLSIFKKEFNFFGDFILLKFYLIKYLMLNSNTCFLVYLLFVKHLFLMSFYLIIIQILFLNWFTLTLGGIFSSYVEMMGKSMLENFKLKFKYFMIIFNLKGMVFLGVEENLKDSIFGGLMVFFVFLMMFWVFI